MSKEKWLFDSFLEMIIPGAWYIVESDLHFTTEGDLVLIRNRFEWGETSHFILSVQVGRDIRENDRWYVDRAILDDR